MPKKTPAWWPLPCSKPWSKSISTTANLSPKLLACAAASTVSPAYRRCKRPRLSSIVNFAPPVLRKVDLASRMGIPKTVVDRLFDLDHHTRMNQIEAAFEALGKRIGIV